MKKDMKIFYYRMIVFVTIMYFALSVLFYYTAIKECSSISILWLPLIAYLINIIILIRALIKLN